MSCILVRANGTTQHHTNLGWIHRHTEGIREVHIDQKKNIPGGILKIHFFNGDVYHADFASLGILKGHISRWRNLEYDAVTLYVNGECRGVVFSKNPALIVSPTAF